MLKKSIKIYKQPQNDPCAIINRMFTSEKYNMENVLGIWSLSDSSLTSAPLINAHSDVDIVISQSLCIKY